METLAVPLDGSGRHQYDDRIVRALLRLLAHHLKGTGGPVRSRRQAILAMVAVRLQCWLRAALCSCAFEGEHLPRSLYLRLLRGLVKLFH